MNKKNCVGRYYSLQMKCIFFMKGKEKLMKKIRFAAVMVLLISVLLLPACGSTPKTDSSGSSSMSSGEVDGAGKDMADDAKDAGEDMKDAAGDMANGMKDAAGDMADGAKDAGESMTDGAKKAADGMKDAMTPDSTNDSTNTARDTAGTDR